MDTYIVFLKAEILNELARPKSSWTVYGAQGSHFLDDQSLAKSSVRVIRMKNFMIVALADHKIGPKDLPLDKRDGNMKTRCGTEPSVINCAVSLGGI